LYSASHGYQPPLMRCHVTNDSRPTTQATAHSLRTQAWPATPKLAGQTPSAVGLHLRITTHLTTPEGWQAESALLADW